MGVTVGKIIETHTLNISLVATICPLFSVPADPTQTDDCLMLRCPQNVLVPAFGFVKLMLEKAGRNADLADALKLVLQFFPFHYDIHKGGLSVFIGGNEKQLLSFQDAIKGSPSLKLPGSMGRMTFALDPQSGAFMWQKPGGSGHSPIHFLKKVHPKSRRDREFLHSGINMLIFSRESGGVSGYGLTFNLDKTLKEELGKEHGGAEATKEEGPLPVVKRFSSVLLF